MRRQNPSAVLREIVGEKKALELEEAFGDDMRRIFGSDEPTLRAQGVSPAKVREILRVNRAMQEWFEGGQNFHEGRVRGGRDVAALFRPRFVGLEIEQFWAAALNTKNKPTKVFRVSEGSLSASLVHPREVFTPLLRVRAAAVVFAHNHPSGDPTPSVEDIEITKRLVEVANIVGIRVLDHVVLGAANGYVSFQERGLI